MEGGTDGCMVTSEVLEYENYEALEHEDYKVYSTSTLRVAAVRNPRDCKDVTRALTVKKNH